MKKWFTSDWHLNDDRIGINGKPNLFFRPFKSVNEQNLQIHAGFTSSGFKDGDELWHLGDVVYSWSRPDTKTHGANFVLQSLRQSYPNSKFNLIIGNYDEDKLDRLGKYFDNIYEDYYTHLSSTARGVYLNHYPIRCLKELNKTHNPWDFAITGHIHGLWKVQKNMVNVGVDAWHFQPIPEETIEFVMSACAQYYDENVFPY